ncbi:MAG TPA: hypothetical protein DCW76_14655 [Lysinibacillus sp.]|nr:hypothetical protein [Lysinibacillus sp.]
MVLLENVIDNPHYLFLLSILIYVIPRAINYWNTTQFEKKFMNDLQRIKISFWKLIVIVTFIMIISYVRILFDPEKRQEIFSVESSVVISIFLVIGAIIVVLFQVLIIIMNWFEKKLTLTADYYLKLDNTNEEWKIIKMSSNNCLILRKKCDKKVQMMLEDWKGLEIREVRSGEIPFSKLFKLSNQYRNIPMILLIVILIVISIAFMFSPFLFFGRFSLILYVIGGVGSFISVIILKNYTEYKNSN